MPLAFLRSIRRNVETLSMELTAGAIEKIKCGDIANDAVKVQVNFC